jgi:hypothetical protein
MGGLIMSKLYMIKGITEHFEIKLNEAGVASVEGFLDACASKKGRADLARKVGVLAL